MNNSLDVASGGNKTLILLSALIEVASRFGVELTIEQLQRQFSISSSSISGVMLVSICKELGLEAKILRMKFSELPKLAGVLPVILMGRDNSALLLEGARQDPRRGSVAIVRDPSANHQSSFVVDELALSSLWEGDVIIIKKRLGLLDELQPFGIKWLVMQILREKHLFRDIAIAALVNTIFAIVPAFVTMIIIDRVLVNNSYSTLKVLVGAILLMILFETLLAYFRRVLTQVVTTRIDGRMNIYVLERLLKLPLTYFERQPVGETLSKIREIWRIRSFMTGQLFGTLIDAVPLIAIIPAMLIWNWQLSIIAFSMVAVIAAIVMIFMGPVSKRQKIVIAAESAKSAHLAETLYGIKTIKSLSLEGRRRKDWDRLIAISTDAKHDLGLMANYPQSLSIPFERLMAKAPKLIGAWIIVSNPDVMNAGSLIGFTMLSSRLASPLLKLAHLQSDLAEIRGSVSEVASVLNSEPEETRQTGLKTSIKGEISFSDVRFRYSADGPYALDGVSFTIPAGSVVGIMGRSGSGKSTITRLLQRLNSNYEGMIKIDGSDLKELDLTHLRSNIGVVPQENFLFSGTVRDNISMAKSDSTFADIVRAAQLAGAEEFIERMPRGYDSLLSEGGSNLSGGQRQRLAIARALLINPPVLILDEATSALDAESESIVGANLKRMAKGRTVISISHRLSMLVDSDVILVMERGKLYDIGSHEELLQRCDIYKQLWHQQNRGKVLGQGGFILPEVL